MDAAEQRGTSRPEPVSAWQRFRSWRRWILLVVALYALIYVPNSAAGGYWLRPRGDGDTELGGVDLPVLVRWQPRYGRLVAGADTDWLGGVFKPMIILDRLLVHHDINVGTTQGLLRLAGAIRAGDIHPSNQAQLERLLGGDWSP